MGVERLVSTINWSVSGSMLIYQRVTPGSPTKNPRRLPGWTKTRRVPHLGDTPSGAKTGVMAMPETGFGKLCGCCSYIMLYHVISCYIMLNHVISCYQNSQMIFECLHLKSIETTSQNLQLVPPACRSIPRASGPSSLARSPSKGSNSVTGCEPTCIHCNSPIY